MVLINKVCTFAISKTCIAVGCTGASYFLSKSELEKVIEKLPEEEVVVEDIPKVHPGYGDLGNGTWLDL